jgi:hypothetical protein
VSRCAAAGARVGELCVQEGEEGGGRGEGGFSKIGLVIWLMMALMRLLPHAISVWVKGLGCRVSGKY